MVNFVIIETTSVPAFFVCKLLMRICARAYSPDCTDTACRVRTPSKRTPLTIRRHPLMSRHGTPCPYISYAKHFDANMHTNRFPRLYGHGVPCGNAISLQLAANQYRRAQRLYFIKREKTGLLT